MFAEMDELAFKSKNLYNRANYSIRQEFFQSGGILSYYSIDKIMQSEESYQALPAKVSQHVLIMLCRNWKAWKQASAEYKRNPSKFLGEPKIPRYKHKTDGRNLLIYTLQAIAKPALKQGIINPSKTNIAISTRVKPDSIAQVRLVPKLDHYVIEVIYEKPNTDLRLKYDAIASIDIGVDNLAAVTSNHKGFRPILVNGRHIKSVNQYYNKRKAELQSRLKGNQKTSKRIQKLSSKRNWKVNHYLHCASAFIINTLVQHGIGTLVIGKNDGWKQEVNHGKQNNQNFVCIPHVQFIQQLEYKAALVGIKIVLNEESYTSIASFLDSDEIPTYGKVKGEPSFSGRRVKSQRHSPGWNIRASVAASLYKSKNGTLINADINGSANTLRKVFPNAFADGIEGVVVRPTRILVK